VSAAKASRPLMECIDELGRELMLRQRCYDRWVAEGRLSATDAADRLARHESAMAFLTAVARLPVEEQQKVLDTA